MTSQDDISKHKLLKLNSVIALLAIVAVVVLALFGNNLRSIWPLNSQIAVPEKAHTSCNVNSVIDQQGHRLSILNSNWEIIRMLETDRQTEVEGQYTHDLATDEGVYFSTKSIYPDSEYISSEQVYCLYPADNAFSKAKLLYQKKYSESQKIINPSFLSIDYGDDNDIYLVEDEINTKSVNLISLKINIGKNATYQFRYVQSDKFTTASYCPGKNILATISSSGNVYLSDNKHEIKEILSMHSSSITDFFWYDSENLCCFDNLNNKIGLLNVNSNLWKVKSFDENIYSINRHYSDKKIICSTYTSLDIYDIDSILQTENNNISPDISLNSFSYSLFFSVRLILLWIVVIFLIFASIFLIINAIKKLNQSNKIVKLLGIFFATITFISVVGVVLFQYTRFYEYQHNEYAKLVSSICDDVSTNSANFYSKNMLKQSAESSDYINKIHDFANSCGEMLHNKCISYYEYDIPILIIEDFYINKSHYLLVVDVDRYWVIQNSRLDIDLSSSSIDDINNTEVFTTEKKIEDITFYDYITSEKICKIQDQDALYTKVFYNTNALNKNFYYLSASSIIILLSIFSVIAFISIEIITYLKNKAKRKRVNKKNCLSPILCTRQLSFFMNFAIVFDSTITVLVAKEILENQGQNQIGVLVGLPTVFFQVGIVIGFIIFGIIASKFPCRDICVVSTIFAAISFFGIFIAVSVNSFIMFCILKFCAALFLGLPDAASMSIPLLAKNEEERYSTFSDYYLAGISGTSIGWIICGLITAVAENSIIYLACIIPCILIIFIVIKYFSKNMILPKAINKRNVKNTKKADLFKFFISAPILSLLIFIMIPVMTMNSYQTIFFPLVMDDSGYSKILINCIIVISTSIVFLANTRFTKFISKFNAWHVTVFGLLTCSLIMFLFFVTNNPFWFVFILIPIFSICQILLPNFSILAIRQAHDKDFSDGQINNTILILRCLIGSIPSILLSYLYAEQQETFFIYLGTMCLVGALLFVIITKKELMKTFYKR